MVDLQFVKAMHLYVRIYNSKFSDEPSSIIHMLIHDDSIIEKPFMYKRADSKAILELPTLKEAGAIDTIQFQLRLRE